MIMGLTAKFKNGNNSNSSSDGWGMRGFLLVLFHEDDAVLHRKKTLLSLSSSGPATRTTASATASTLSICGLLVFATFLLFTLSTFEPTSAAAVSATRRHLIDRRPQLNPQNSPEIKPNYHHPFSLSGFSTFFRKPSNGETPRRHALQGMGMLFRRGTNAMTDLIVAHVADDVEEREFRVFLRFLHFNGVLSHSDLIFIFSSSSPSLSQLIEEENENFLKILNFYSKSNRSTHDPVDKFGLTRYLKIENPKSEQRETLWGKKKPRLANLTTESPETGPTSPVYGSVIRFEVSELDPEDSLAGFMDHRPMGLRRWACFPMLLGRVRRNFKHVMLLDAKEMLVLGDPFTHFSKRAPESLLLWTDPDLKQTRNRNRDNHNEYQPLDPGIMIGGSRGVRRFANFMLTQIVRCQIGAHGKGKDVACSESQLLNELIRNGYLLKSINLINPWTELISNARFNSAELSVLDSNAVVKRGNGGRFKDIGGRFTREMCKNEIYSCVYRDCLEIQ